PVFFFYSLVHHRVIHSFPTRRSSDLVRVIRPLLGWRRIELEQICTVAGVTTVADPSNQDSKYERVRVRQAMSEAGWLDPGAVARDRKSTRLNSSHVAISYAVFCLKKK